MCINKVLMVGIIFSTPISLSAMESAADIEERACEEPESDIFEEKVSCGCVTTASNQFAAFIPALTEELQRQGISASVLWGLGGCVIGSLYGLYISFMPAIVGCVGDDDCEPGLFMLKSAAAYSAISGVLAPIIKPVVLAAKKALEDNHRISLENKQN